jgi:hypothetical protein
MRFAAAFIAGAAALSAILFGQIPQRALAHNDSTTIVNVEIRDARGCETLRELLRR